jgi:hypothetical protein
MRALMDLRRGERYGRRANSPVKPAIKLRSTLVDWRSRVRALRTWHSYERQRTISMTNAAITIAAAPLAAALEPFIAAVVTAIIGAFVPLAYLAFHRWTGIVIQQAALDRLTAAAKTEAAALVLAAEDNFASQAIPVGSKIIAGAAAQVEASLPDVMSTAGVTPDGLARLVAGELGKLQASMTKVDPSASHP